MTYAEEVLADTPVGYWKLDETSGTAAADSSGTGNAGTYENVPTLGEPSIMPNGGEGTSVFFEAPSEHVAIPNAASLQLAAGATCEAWFVHNTGSTVPHLFAEIYGGPHVNYQLGGWDGATNSNKPSFGFFNGSLGGWTGNIAQSPDGVTIPSPNAYYIVGTYDGTLLKIYVDAVLKATVTAANPMASDDDGVRLNRRWDGVGNSCWLQHMALYNYALSPTRITAHYNAGLVQRAGWGILIS